MARNTFKEDERLDEPFNVRHLLRASSYIRKYSGKMIAALILSAMGGASALVSPMLIGQALDTAIPQGNVRMLVSFVLALMFFMA